MLFQSYKSDFFPYMIKDVEAHGARSNKTIMKNSEVNDKHKHKDG